MEPVQKWLTCLPYLIKRESKACFTINVYKTFFFIIQRNRLPLGIKKNADYSRFLTGSTFYTQSFQ